MIDLNEYYNINLTLSGEELLNFISEVKLTDAKIGQIILETFSSKYDELDEYLD